MGEGDRIALIIACDRYSDPELKELQAPSQDAERFARILEDPKIGGFKVTALINQPHWTITEKLNGFLKSCKKEDTVLLYFSCHGIKDADGQLYFATITTNRPLLLSTGIESNFVNRVLDHCRAQQKVVLLDCCYSGAFEKGKIVRADTQVNAAEFFGKGRVIITASDSMQYAFEADDRIDLGKGGSYFTNALIKGLESGEADADNDGKITYSELYDYVYNHVKSITPNQTPTLNTQGVEGDFVIFKNMRDNAGSGESKQPPLGTEFDEDRTTDTPEHHEARDPILEFIAKARTLLEEGQYDNAIKVFDTILIMRPEHVEALNGKGLALYKQKKYKEALECFNEVLKVKPRHPEASDYLELTSDRLSKEHSGEEKSSGRNIEQDAALERRAEQQVIKALDKSTQIPMELIKKGDMFLEKRMYQEAILCYDQALKIEPRSELAWKRKGNALLQKGDVDEGVSCYNEAWKINPFSQMNHDNITSDEHVAGADPRNPYNDATLPYYNPNLDNKAESSQDIQKPSQQFHREYKPEVNSAIPYVKDADYWYNKGLALDNLGKYQDAIACYDETIELKSDHAKAWYNKGLALDNLGKYQDAIACYDETIELKSDHAKAWYNKGLALYSSGKYKQAIDCYDRAIQLDQNDAKAWYNKGLALYSSGKYKQAIDCYDRAIQLDQNDAKTWYNKGNALNNLKSYKQAIDCYDRAIQLDQNDAKTWNNKGYALFNVGREEKAKACYDKAVQLDPKYALAWHNKGKALNKMGRKKDAKECYDKAKDLGFKG